MIVIIEIMTDIVFIDSQGINMYCYDARMINDEHFKWNANKLSFILEIHKVDMNTTSSRKSTF